VASSTSINWTWSAAGGAAGHQLIPSTGGIYSPVLSAAAEAFQSDALLPNTSYTAFVTAQGCAAHTESNVFVATTLAKPLDGPQIAGAFQASVTVNWIEFPASPQTDSANGYLLEASTAPNFTGDIASSSTVNVALSTLSVVGLLGNTTYYLRAGAYNAVNVMNFTYFDSTFTATAEIGVIISTHDLDVGSVDVNSDIVISTSFIVTSLGNVGQDYEIRATTITTSSPWQISTTSGTDTFTLQAVFNLTLPATGDFEEADKLLDSFQACAPGVFSFGETCVGVPPGADRLLWFKLGMPKITTTEATQEIQIIINATLP